MTTRRTIEHDGWTIEQVLQSDGTWWNITVERTAAVRARAEVRDRSGARGPDGRLYTIPEE